MSILLLISGHTAQADYVLTTLASFTGANGYWVDGSLIVDASGNLYGTTYYGGANDQGTVFEVAAGSHTLSGWSHSPAPTARDLLSV